MGCDVHSGYAKRQLRLIVNGRCAILSALRRRSDEFTRRRRLDVHPRVATAILRHSRIALTAKVYTQVPDKTARDALKRPSHLLGDYQCDAEYAVNNVAAEGGADRRNRLSTGGVAPNAVRATKKAGYVIATGL